MRKPAREIIRQVAAAPLITLKFHDASASIERLHRVAVVRLTGRLDEDVLPWLRSDIRNACKRLDVVGVVFSALGAEFRLSRKALEVHAVIESLGEWDTFQKFTEATAWLTPRSEVQTFVNYAGFACQRGLLRAAFDDFSKQGRAAEVEPLEWVYEVELGNEDDGVFQPLTRRVA